jgi:hypothetical protein
MVDWLEVWIPKQVEETFRVVCTRCGAEDVHTWPNNVDEIETRLRESEERHSMCREPARGAPS